MSGQDKSEQDNYVLLNPRELEDYILKAAGKHASAAAARHAAAALAPLLARRAENLRLANEQDLARHDPETVALQAHILGRKFYVFDPARDTGLRDHIIKAAKLVDAILDGQEAFRKLAGAPGETPGFLRADFLHAALGVPAAAPPAPALDKNGLKALLRDALKESGLENAIRPDTEDSLKFGDGWKIARYISFDRLERDNAAFSQALGTIDRELMQAGKFLYYGVVDDTGAVRALLKTDDDNRLLLNRAGPDLLPPREAIDRVVTFAKHKELNLDADSGHTGLVRTSAQIANFLALPENTELAHFTLSGYKHPFSLKNVFSTGKFFSEFKVRDCPEFESLAAIGKAEGGIEIVDCPKFCDLGKLAVVGDDYFGRGLTVRNCPGLASLGGIVKIYGKLDIRGTAIRALPESLKSVTGRIYTDAGDFRWLWQARRALARKYGAAAALPPPQQAAALPAPAIVPTPYP
jgi:hypothetical protein